MEIIKEARKLWHSTFGDSDEWIEMYLSATGAADRLLYIAAEDNSRIVSQLFMPCYRMRFHGSEIAASYIAGAATVRSERGKGLMRELLHRALVQSYRDGDAICMLIPASRALYNYYAMSGFETVFYISEERYTAAHIFNTSPRYTCVPASECDTEEMAAAYARCTDAYGCMVIHEPGEFRAVVRDIRMEGGDAYVCRDDDGAIVGVAFALPRHGETVVQEIAAESDEIRDTLLDVIKERFNNMSVVVVTPPDRRPAPVAARAMARICNVSAILSAYASQYPETRCVIRVTDPVIDGNNHIYIIRKGDVTVDDRYQRTPDLDVTVSVLTAILFSAPKTGTIFDLHTVRPYMTLMLD